ncbi:hypothetical protein D3C80_1962260 [compost metagenome]
MAGAVVLAQGPVDADAVQGRVGDHGSQAVLVGGGLDQFGVALLELLHQFAQYAAAHAGGAAEIVIDHQHAHFQWFVGTPNHGTLPPDIPFAETR